MSIRSPNDIQPDPFPIPGIWQSPGPTTLDINLHFFNVNQPPSLLTLPPPHTYFTILYTINLLSIYNHLKAFQDLRTISWKGSIKFQNMCLHLPAITRSISVTRPGWQVSVFCSRLKLPPSGLDPTTVTEQCHPFHRRLRQKNASDWIWTSTNCHHCVTDRLFVDILHLNYTPLYIL